MKIYIEEIKEVINSGQKYNGFLVNKPSKAMGFYRFLDREYDKDSQTLGAVKIIENKAYNSIIPFWQWDFINEPFRVIVEQIHVLPRGKFKDLADTLLVAKTDFKVKLIDFIEYNYVYLRFLRSKHGFYLDNGIIKFPDPDLKIEQFPNIEIIEFPDKQYPGEVIYMVKDK